MEGGREREGEKEMEGREREGCTSITLQCVVKYWHQLVATKSHARILSQALKSMGHSLPIATVPRSMHVHEHYEQNS